MAVLIDPSVPVKSTAAKNDVAIFIFLTSLLCILTTDSATFIPAEASCRNYLIWDELQLFGNAQEIFVNNREVSRYHPTPKYQRRGSREQLVLSEAAYSKSDHETATNMFESYCPAYSREGSITNEALQAAIDDAMMRAKIEKAVTLTQVADRALIAEAQKELGIR